MTNSLIVQDINSVLSIQFDNLSYDMENHKEKVVEDLRNINFNLGFLILNKWSCLEKFVVM